MSFTIGDDTGVGSNAHRAKGLPKVGEIGDFLNPFRLIMSKE
ncbi:hypothetical protein [Sphingobacterium bambusae]|uniref:Uncharacterized protein n=1 Tax=Sphingobacterium bambusae TaxID=662858 RepID=A0ABW6BN87_9SPHI|nr:hypothetical protein [Sphingobacterium bambusae]WPL46678.1 hypothetical protein SCB77_11930 [Sphingobacterium bambusae]